MIKGMYGLKQAGILANQLLQQRLSPFGYYTAQHTYGRWLRTPRPIACSLIVDNFTEKYVVKENAEHFRNALLRSYELTTYWGGTVCSGTTLKWYYQKRTCDIYMPGYVANVLIKFQHENPKQPQHTPSK
jgi:hypothetical protein